MRRNGLLVKAVATVLILSMLLACPVSAEAAQESNRETFFLICNEGMNNAGGNVGNTMMVISVEPDVGTIRLLMMTWDTFINYEGFDTPQLIDQPYRNKGPEETMRVFNANFGQSIDQFLSINYLSLANLIDAFGGVNVDITRAERNAMNELVASKKSQLLAAEDSGLVEQTIAEMLAQEYYLNEWGENTHLNGLQAVSFGWLQYDSVYNCCKREALVIANLFASVGDMIGKEIAFYTDATGMPADVGNRRAINLDAITESDEKYLVTLVKPIFDNSYNNLAEDTIAALSVALAKSAYNAARQGVRVFSGVEFKILPLEATDPYETVAGVKGHVIDTEKNAMAIDEFLFGER